MQDNQQNINENINNDDGGLGALDGFYIEGTEQAEGTAPADADKIVESADNTEVAESTEIIENIENTDNTESTETTPSTENTDASESVTSAKKPKKQKGALEVFEYVETFAYAVAVMVLLFMFVFRYVTVDGTSMRDTLQHEDKLIISNLFYTPATGDIVVINRTENAQPLIKRVIATGGQTVRIDFESWQVWVDGILLDEDYVTLRSEMPMHSYPFVEKYTNSDGICEFVVDDGCIFAMGDNRNNSLDSRKYGFFEYHEIVGRVVLRLAPRFGTVE